MVKLLTILTSLLLSACACSDHGPPPTPAEPRLATEAERTGVAAEPRSEASCKPACAAAGAVDCERIIAVCGYAEDDHKGRHVFLGAQVLGCGPAKSVACHGKLTGMDACVRDCIAGET